MPYHNLGLAHRRLMAELPAESIYRETAKVSLLGEIAQLWRRSSEVARQSRAESQRRSTALPMPVGFIGSRMAVDGSMIEGRFDTNQNKVSNRKDAA
jgi:hypothetical protein